MTGFQPIPKEFNVPVIEREIADFWHREDVLRRYLTRNEGAEERYSFIDGPITANGPMGVHHAWGRTYKDLWQRYNTMLGKRQRYQNGFDCQGLWVEVTTERELGFTSKRDIEQYGIEAFVRKCKESVFHFAAMQTSQSQRLGMFMDWENSYFTLSDENNYMIWHFLKTCHERGLLYKGRDVMPWCTRCGTGISETEAAEGYQELTHTAVFVRFPLVDRPGESLLVWTTTPWTLTSNVAVAVNPELTYLRVRQGNDVFYVAQGAAAVRGPQAVLDEVSGSQLLGWRYRGPFDDLPAERAVEHTIIPWEEVSAEEGTGLVHIAPGCGKEDFALGKEFGLAVVAPLDQNGIYGAGFDWLTGRNVLEVSTDIVADLDRRGLLYRAEQYTHRYPTCWRCGTQLAFRLVDEWFIAMDSLREPMAEVVRSIRWIPPFGLDRELDWLRNMDDWMISKKRYWGLALPFWICPNEHLQVIGSKAELVEKAVSGLEGYEEPHRPWVDAVLLRCPECGETATRIADVGNPWLDAGIVPYSTLKYDRDPEYWRTWFPADFITESFPGQFRNWFYSMLAMSTVLENTAPFQTVLGYALLRDLHGREMHKSWGNTIPFDEAADRAGADTMRWLFVLHSVETNLNFGWEALDEVKRRLLVLWNTCSFFLTYASLDRWTPESAAPPVAERPVLDRWIVARLSQVVAEVRAGLDDYDAARSARAIEGLIEELSTWYVRRSRRRFWKAEDDADKGAAYATLNHCLTTMARLIAPFMPFLAEYLYQTLVRRVDDEAPVSVHLTDYPAPDSNLIDDELLAAMATAQEIVGLGRAARDRANVLVRQPLARLYVRVPDALAARRVEQLREIILDELNVRDLTFASEQEEFVDYTVRPNLPVLGPRYGKRLAALRAGLEAMIPAEVAAAVHAGRTVRVAIDGETVELAPDDLLVSARERPGYAAMAENGYLVALDTRITPELRQEGWIRQVVRRVNDWRKLGGFNVDDRVVIRYQASPELAAALDRFGDFVRSETLAASLMSEPATGVGYAGEASFDGQTLRVEIERTEPAR
jgi:isoleucyl-tRNA synthetase